MRATSTACVKLPVSVRIQHRVQGAMEMGRLPWYQVPRHLHLRLLGALCNDILQCGNIRGTLDDRTNKATDAVVRATAGGSCCCCCCCCCLQLGLLLEFGSRGRGTAAAGCAAAAASAEAWRSHAAVKQQPWLRAA